MIGHGRASRTLPSCIAMLLIALGAQARDHAVIHMDARFHAAPVAPPIMPQTDSIGSCGLRMRFDHYESVRSNLELRRHQYFLDDNLKTQHPRTSIAWSVRWYF